MKYIVATTDSNYFRWQMLVQINNFKRLGILDDLIYVVSIDKKKSSQLKLLENKTGVKVYTYSDTRKSKLYACSITGHIMAKFFKKYAQFGKCFLYLDPDVLFREKPNFNESIINDNVWYGSNVKSYIGVKYIQSKSDELFKLMCESINIDPKLVIKCDNSVCGAQMLIKNVDYKYWENVEKDSESLYKIMNCTKKIYNPKAPIQTWTAEMWAVLWGAWKINKYTSPSHELKFSWSTDKLPIYEKSNILHNAGVFGERYLFNKTLFMSKKPFNTDFSYVSKDYCSIKYVNEIIETKQNYGNIINKI